MGFKFTISVNHLAATFAVYGLNEFLLLTGFCIYDYSDFENGIPAKLNNCLEIHKSLSDRNGEHIMQIAIIEILVYPISFFLGICYFFRKQIVNFIKKILKQ